MHLASQSAHRSFALHCFAFRYCCYYTAYCGSIMSFAIACLSRISCYKELLFISHYCFSLPSYWLLAGCLVCLTAVCFLLACLLIAYYYYDISHQTVPCVCVTLYFVCTISIIIIACIFAYYLQRVSFFMVSWCSPSCLAVLICQEAARLEC